MMTFYKQNHEIQDKMTHRTRKLLTIESSTPVTNGGRMSYGNVVAVARFSVTGVDEGPGASNAIVAIAS
jgi:hypothetical protein